MIKECQVISRNAINIVALYDATQIQLPSNDDNSKVVYVSKDGEKFSISSKKEFELQKTGKKNSKEKSD